MGDTPARDATIRRLIRWAVPRDAVRALLLTSTRAVPGAAVDARSDYDVILVARDIRPFAADRGWVADFGAVLVAYRDPPAPDPDHGLAQAGNVVQYLDGRKRDFRLWPVALVRAIAGAPAQPPSATPGTPCCSTRTASPRACARRPSAPTSRPAPPRRPIWPWSRSSSMTRPTRRSTSGAASCSRPGGASTTT